MKGITKTNKTKIETFLWNIEIIKFTLSNFNHIISLNISFFKKITVETFIKKSPVTDLVNYKKAIFFQTIIIAAVFLQSRISSHDLERNKGSTWKNSWSIELYVERTIPC
jgi:hypothetical protein